jgi:hypothetical protein
MPSKYTSRYLVYFYFFEENGVKGKFIDYKKSFVAYSSLFVQLSEIMRCLRVYKL